MQKNEFRDTSVNLKGDVPEWAAGTAAVIGSVAAPALKAYSIRARNEINLERIKMGLPPLIPQNAVTAPPPIIPEYVKEKFTKGGLALAAIVLLLLFMSRKPAPQVYVSRAPQDAQRIARERALRKLTASERAALGVS